MTPDIQIGVPPPGLADHPVTGGVRGLVQSPEEWLVRVGLWIAQSLCGLGDCQGDEFVPDRHPGRVAAWPRRMATAWPSTSGSIGGRPNRLAYTFSNHPTYCSITTGILP